MKNKNVTKLETRNNRYPLSVWVYILLVGILFIILSTQGAYAQLTGYKYKDAIKVHENSGAQKVNYQVMLNINTAALVSAGKMQANGSDIRFAKDCKGATLLNYYIETGMNTSNTIIWVEADTLPAGGDYIMYMWYGNSTATGVSSFNNTFPITTVFIDSSAAPQAVTGTKAYSWFEIRSGSTVTVGPDSIMKIYARRIKIDGILNGNGAGFAGGLSQSDGSGPGAGHTPTDGNAFGDGGGGASYGGSGGTGGDNTGTPSGQLGLPGALYGTANTDSIDMGSGGGGGSTTRGAGGGGILLSGDVVEISGTINANGSNGTLTTLNGAGGGGSGGGILIKGWSVNFSGNLTANGGNGGNGAFSGGGGGGGRIKILHDNSISNTGNEQVNGGQIGSENTGIIAATPGDSGTYYTGTYASKIPSYTFLPHVTLSTSGTTVCQGSSVTFTASSGFNKYNFYVDTTSKQNSASTTYATTSLSDNDMVKVLAADTKGCMDTSNVIKMTVNPSPVADAGTMQVICNGGSVAIGGSPTGSGGTGTLSYAWLPSGSLNNASTANPTASPTSSTQYTVTVSDANGCKGTDTATVSVQVCTGVQQLASSDNEFRSYPTVCKSYFTVEANFATEQSVDIELTNMLGQNVIAIEHSNISGSYKKEVNISSLPEGIYFLVFQTDKRTIANKIIKN